MELSGTLHSKIIDFLTSLPNIHDTETRKGLIYSAGFEKQLQNLIVFDGASLQFSHNLVATVSKYGMLEDGQLALQALLEATKAYIGQDKRIDCDTLIQELYDEIKNLPLVSKTVNETNLAVLMSELSEWKIIHNESQELVNLFHRPLNFVKKYQSTNNSTWLEAAGFEWQHSCLRKLEKIPNEWKFQRAETPALSHLNGLITKRRLNVITRMFMQPDIPQEEFEKLLFKVTEIYDRLWDLLTAADKRMLILIGTLQGLVKG